MTKCKFNYWLFLFSFLVSGLFFTSCGSKKVLYHPGEVSQLSGQLGIQISNSDQNMPLYAEASTWLGTPYRYAGLNRSGVDCSGLVHCLYRDVYGKKVSRSSEQLAKDARKVKKSKLKAGDVVFFATSKNKKKISHAGIFLKDGYFIHASSSRGVIISHLNEDYYRRTWKKGGRLK